MITAKLLTSLLAMVLLSGCIGFRHHHGAPAGPVVGAGVGAVIGSQADPENPVEGAIFGGLLGYTAGAILTQVGHHGPYPHRIYLYTHPGYMFPFVMPHLHHPAPPRKPYGGGHHGHGGHGHNGGGH